MFDFLHGKLVGVGPGVAIIEVGGIGFRVNIPVSLASRLGELGAECRVYTHLLFREERVELYGFAEARERELFGLLLGISGVGPKVALALLSCLSVAEIEKAVREGEVAVLQMVPGIGKKTAARLILELKDKVGKREVPIRDDTADAVEALVALGYRRGEAQEAVRRVIEEGVTGVEAILRAALNLLLKRKDVQGG
ncbi:Holliday junction branch migration protein RuvA [Thermodesulfitimonas autotrophica]|uniref:Holliday junction branch migration protein RuvA n=1 Tax=Thermodesulfitimonas autotrophica TaxID=1894989 RepID=UPI002FE05883